MGIDYIFYLQAHVRIIFEALFFEERLRENTTSGMKPGKAQLSGQHKSSKYSRSLTSQKTVPRPQALLVVCMHRTMHLQCKSLSSLL